MCVSVWCASVSVRVKCLRRSAFEVMLFAMMSMRRKRMLGRDGRKSVTRNRNRHCEGLEHCMFITVSCVQL